MAARLKNILPSLIDEAQSTFIPGRLMSCNIFIAQEVLRNYHRLDTRSRCATKVDLHKAFDTVKWSFLLELMENLGFPSTFIGWVRTCISSPKYSININGELVGFFGASRGLRQGDPLSPYLFTIIMDALSMLIRQNIEKNRLAGTHFDYHWRCQKTKLTHLCFADDLLLFCGGSLTSVKILHNALQEFYSLSGLHPNNGKSNVFIAGRNQAYMEAVRDLFQFQVGELPVRYLGVPLLSTKLTISNCKPLVDCITSRISNWTVHFLSFAGRLQLIKSVLCSIHSFWNGLFILPKAVLRRIEQILRKALN